MDYKPSYLKLSIENLKNRAREAKKMLSSCNICPWNCYADRLTGEMGHCRSQEKARVSSYNAHFGEEPELVGTYGSGAK